MNQRNIFLYLSLSIILLGLSACVSTKTTNKRSYKDPAQDTVTIYMDSSNQRLKFPSNEVEKIRTCYNLEPLGGKDWLCYDSTSDGILYSKNIRENPMKYSRSTIRTYYYPNGHEKSVSTFTASGNDNIKCYNFRNGQLKCKLNYDIKDDENYNQDFRIIEWHDSLGNTLIKNGNGYLDQTKSDEIAPFVVDEVVYSGKIEGSKTRDNFLQQRQARRPVLLFLQDHESVNLLRQTQLPVRNQSDL
jgi:hypothetical protein